MNRSYLRDGNQARQAILRRSGRLLTHPRIDIHIHSSSLIRYDRKWLRFRPQVTSGFASLHIQNIVARRQSNAIFSVPICGDTRHFAFSGLTQDYQRIIAIVLNWGWRRGWPSQLNLFMRSDPQIALEESRWSIAARTSAAEQKQDEKAENGALAKRFHFTKKAGRGSYATAPPEQELSVSLRYLQRPDAAAVRRGVQHLRPIGDRQSCNFGGREAATGDYPGRSAGW